jgi:hypothetical protein
MRALTHISLFLQTYWTAKGARIFNIDVEGEKFNNVDIFVMGGNQANVAFPIQIAKLVDDGFVTITMTTLTDNAKLSGIEIRLKELHTAHAVSQGPVRVNAAFFGEVSLHAFAPFSSSQFYTAVHCCRLGQ